MASIHPHDTVILTTPLGHEVVAEVDYDDFAVSHAKVINHYTGVMQLLDTTTSETLARALQAKHVYENALAETRTAEMVLNRYNNLMVALGKDHPAVAPYWQEAEQHRSIARDMFNHAQRYHAEAMDVIDKLVEKKS